MNAATVVPVRGGDQATAANLRAIGSAARHAGVHVFLVDNGMARRIRGDLGQKDVVEVLDCTRIGSYAARNVGVRAALRAGHGAILFTDADCRPRAGWPSHLLDVLRTEDVVTSVAAPRPVAALGTGASLDYRVRLAQWAGAELRCGEPVNTMDTRAAAVRAEVFDDGLFDDRLRFGGDAVLGRRIRAAGGRVVGCHHEILEHDPPRGWLEELHKYRRIAAGLVDDLRALPRRDVLWLLPEHAHLLLPPPPDVLVAARERLYRAVRGVDLVDPERVMELYRAVRELGWSRGWVQSHHRRLAAARGSDRVPGQRHEST